MKIFFILLAASCGNLILEVHSEIRYKLRGPPGPPSAPRPPLPPPYYSKSKWPLPPRYPIRNIRPVPLHMGLHKNQPLYKPQFFGNVPKTPSPYVFSGAAWKNPQTIYKPLIDKPILQFPPIDEQYDFAVLNKEPVHMHTIKQVGEKGPIHTIPAPNLTPADKPAHIIEGIPQKNIYHYEKEPDISFNTIGINNAQALPLISHQKHQYQVTEQQNEPPQQKPLFAPDPDQNIIGQKFPQYLESGALPSELKIFNSDVFVAQPQTPQQPQDMHLSAQDLYQLLNGIPQQHLIDGIPLQQTNPQHFIQQTSLPNPSFAFMNSHVFQEEPKETNFKPEFHTFNYEEQSSRPTNGYAQSRVTADYSLQEPEAAENTQNTNEAIAQSQYVQHFFGAPSENTNEVDADAKTRSNHNSQVLKQSEMSSSMFYSSLPNKETADAFANLQASGSVRNEMMKDSQSPMEIYVPDEEESYEDTDEREAEHNQGIKVYETTYAKRNRSPEEVASAEYEDYSQEREGEAKETEGAFGSRLKPKNPREIPA